MDNPTDTDPTDVSDTSMTDADEPRGQPTINIRGRQEEYMTDADADTDTDTEAGCPERTDPQAQDQERYTERSHVERTDVGVSITTKIQRGTGTNDRDTISAKVKAETRDEAERELAAIRPALREHVEDVRSWQNGDEDDGGSA